MTLLLMYHFLMSSYLFLSFFFLHDTSPPKIYTFPYTTLFRSYVMLKPRKDWPDPGKSKAAVVLDIQAAAEDEKTTDRKSTRLNSSHQIISYAVFCLKKKTIAPLRSTTLSATIMSQSLHPTPRA